MAPSIPITEPTEAVAGDTWKWQRSVPDYPATDGWALSYQFRGPGAIDASSEASGPAYLVIVSAVQTAALAEGVYEWVASVRDAGGEQYTVGRGRLAVLANFAKLSGKDRQLHAERALALIETQIEQLLASPIESGTAEQTTFTKRKLQDLYAARGRYRSELQRLKGRGRLAPIEVTFGRA